MIKNKVDSHEDYGLQNSRRQLPDALLDFRRVCDQQACHVLQPDLSHCGGLFEARKIAAMGEMYLMGIAPHNPNGPVANIVALHFDLATPNFLIQEEMISDVPWRFEVVRMKPEMKDGHWLAPQARPGF